MLDWLSEHHIFEIAAIIGAFVLIDLIFIAKKKQKDDGENNDEIAADIFKKNDDANTDGGD